MALAAEVVDDQDLVVIRENITHAVKVLMAHRGIRTQTELAAILGVSGPQVTERFKGRTAWRDQDFVRLAKALGVAPSIFLLSREDFLTALNTYGYRLNAAGEPMLFTVVPGPDEPVQTTLPFDRQLTTV